MILYCIILHWLLSYNTISYYIALRRSIKKYNIVRKIIVQDHIIKYYTVIYFVYSWRRGFSKKIWLSYRSSSIRLTISFLSIYLNLSNPSSFIRRDVLHQNSNYIYCKSVKVRIPIMFFSCFFFLVFFPRMNLFLFSVVSFVGTRKIPNICTFWISFSLGGVKNLISWYQSTIGKEEN